MIIFLGLSNFALCSFASETGWNSGINFTLEGAANLRGGAESGQTLHGLALGHVAWAQPTGATDTGISWRAYASMLSLEGDGPTERGVGDFHGASNIEGPEGVRLYSWWVEAAQGAWSLRAGALLADEEFTGTTGGGNFLNSAFGWPAFASANTINTGPAFYAAALGLRFERRFGKNGIWRLGVYDGDTFDSPSGDPGINRHGWHYRLGGRQGWFIMSEAGVSAFDGVRLKLGGWIHTGNFAGYGCLPTDHAINYGVYAAIERTLAGESGKPGNVEGFLRCGLAPSDRNPLAWSFDTGLAWTGLLSGRPTDVAALGFTRAAFGASYAASAFAADPTLGVPDFESVLEVSYCVALSKQCSLQPDVQYIRHPGGSGALRDAVVFFLRFSVSL